MSIRVSHLKGGFGGGGVGLGTATRFALSPPSWGSLSSVPFLTKVPSHTKTVRQYLGTQAGCRVPPGWLLQDRVYPWSWGTAESAASSQGLPPGQGSSGSRRTRTSKVSSLVSLQRRTVTDHHIKTPDSRQTKRL